MAAPATPTSPATSSQGGVAAALFAVAFWGFGNVIAKHVSMSGLSLAFNRLWLGTLVFGGAHLLRGGTFSWARLRLAAVGGVAFACDVGTFFVAVKHTSVADASIITALQPAVLLLLVGPMFGERVTKRDGIWAVLATGGVVVAVLASASGAGRTLWGDVLSVISLFAWCWYFIASKKARQQLGALEYQALLTFVAAVALTPFALLSGQKVAVGDASILGWVVLMVCVPGGGHLLMNWAHGHVTLTLASLMTLGIPVFATIAAVVAIGEPVTALQIGGMAAVLVALVALIRRPPGLAPAVGRADGGPAGLLE